MGRIGFFLTTDSAAEGDALLERDLLAHDLLYLTRGVPVVYYGDEVGMTGTGDGTDKRARQDMFATRVPEWRAEERIGGPPVGDRGSFGGSTAIEARIAQVARLRTANPALSSGAMITRYGEGTVFAASRIDAAARIEYLVVFNTGDVPEAVTIPTSTASSAWTGLLGVGAAEPDAAVSDAAGRVQVTVPARSSLVLRADAELPAPRAPSVSLRVARDFVTGTYRLTAAVPGGDPSAVTFVMRRRGSPEWTVLGTDDARPFRVFVPPTKGTEVELAAIVRDTAGQRASSVIRTQGIRPFL
jgi:hypothetical protein